MQRKKERKNVEGQMLRKPALEIKSEYLIPKVVFAARIFLASIDICKGHRKVAVLVRVLQRTNWVSKSKYIASVSMSISIYL